MTDWDEQWNEDADAFNHEPNEELVRWAWSLVRGSRVLEIGCGGGANLGALQRAGMHPVGCDVAPEAVRRSQSVSDGIEVILTPACELAFPSESFDAVCDVQCFQHLAQEELPLAYKEAARVLKPGGRFFEFFLVAGQEHFPKLTFCEFNLDLIFEAGFSRYQDGGLERRWWGKTPKVYVMGEAIK